VVRAESAGAILGDESVRTARLPPRNAPLEVDHLAFSRRKEKSLRAGTSKAGATGLEPATSGVTGRSWRLTRAPLQSMPVKAGSSAAVHAAAEVDEALWTLDERGEQVRRDDVDGQHLSAGEDAGVVDNGVHTTEVVHVAGDRAYFPRGR
jgi:hypothetical protein